MRHLQRLVILLAAVVLGVSFSTTALAGYGKSNRSYRGSVASDYGYSSYRYRRRPYTPRYKRYNRYGNVTRYHRHYRSRYYGSYYRTGGYSYRSSSYGYGRNYYSQRSCFLCLGLSLNLSIGGSRYGGYGSSY